MTGIARSEVSQSGHQSLNAGVWIGAGQTTGREYWDGGSSSPSTSYRSVPQNKEVEVSSRARKFGGQHPIRLHGILCVFTLREIFQRDIWMAGQCHQEPVR